MLRWAANNREKVRPKTWTLEALSTGVERICNVQGEGGRCIDGNGGRLPSALAVEPMEESSWRLKYEGIRDKFPVRTEMLASFNIAWEMVYNLVIHAVHG